MGALYRRQWETRLFLIDCNTQASFSCMCQLKHTISCTAQSQIQTKELKNPETVTSVTQLI
jgi:hypothetical protein